MSAAAFFFGSTPSGRTALAFCPTSRTVAAPFKGFVRARIMGAAGAGAGDSTGTSGASGGNGATVAIVQRNVAAGDSIVVTLGSGGLGVASAAGNAGGTTTVTGPNGLNASVPGGRGGVLSGGVPAANSNPTGVDQFWLGGIGGAGGTLGGAGGGGSAPLLEGVSSGFNGGAGVGNASGGGAGVGGGGGNGTNGSSGGAAGGSGSAASLNTPGQNLTQTGSASLGVNSDSHSRLFINVSGAGGLSGGGSPGTIGGGATAGGFGSGAGGNGSANAGAAGGRGGGGGGAGSPGGVGGGRGGDAYVVLEFTEVP